jgi:hypothetical protein
MKTTKKNSGIKVTANVKAGGIGDRNHSRPALKVRTTVKAAGIGDRNHSRSGLKVTSGVRGGMTITVPNHNVRLLTAQHERR